MVLHLYECASIEYHHLDLFRVFHLQVKVWLRLCEANKHGGARIQQSVNFQPKVAENLRAHRSMSILLLIENQSLTCLAKGLLHFLGFAV